MPIMQPLVRIKKPKNNPNKFRAYWIESSAPLDVDSSEEAAPKTSSSRSTGTATEGTESFEEEVVEINDPDEAIREIAEYLNSTPSPEIVISIHGFNNNVQVVENRYAQSYIYLSQDECIKNQDGLVCIGYRWPSENLGRPFHSVLKAAPRGLIWVIGIALTLLGTGVALAAPQAQRLPGRNLMHSLFYALGSLLAAIPFSLSLMRIVVYFRDAYRAVNYGVPDLLEVIRHLDKAVVEGHTTESVRPKETRIKLSFIGHSMGAFVVTNLVRILSDVFRPSGMTASLKNSASPWATPTNPPAQKETAETQAKAPNPPDIHHLGNAYTLERLVLVSPDIPAEALLQGRANFLQSSLRRFKEAHLFSNEGDEALRLISTIGNYFSFPTQDRNYGYRLGNVNIVKPPRPGKPEYGIVNLKRLSKPHPGEAQQFLSDLRSGNWTLEKLAGKIATVTTEGASPISQKRNNGNEEITSTDSPLPAKFTYFDCTDYKDMLQQPNGKARIQPIMTFAKQKVVLSDWDHFRLLCGYMAKGRPDVHSGYFSAPLTQCLIYRLSCLGIENTVNTLPPGGKAAKGLNEWSEICKKHQIQVLLSPLHYDCLNLPSAVSSDSKIPLTGQKS